MYYLWFGVFLYFGIVVFLVLKNSNYEIPSIFGAVPMALCTFPIFLALYTIIFSDDANLFLRILSVPVLLISVLIAGFGISVLISRKEKSMDLKEQYKVDGIWQLKD